MNPIVRLQCSTDINNNSTSSALPMASNEAPKIVNGEISFISLRNVVCGANLIRIQKELDKILSKEPCGETEIDDVLFSDVTAQPNYWVTKWVDDINVNGFGYQLSDDTVGAIFRDGTMLIKHQDKDEYDFHDNQGNINAVSQETACPVVTLKIQFLAYTQNYMSTNLVKTGSDIEQNRDTTLPRTHVHTFWRLKHAVVIHLADGTLQVNFFDHVKIILCIPKESVTFINENNLFQSYPFSELQQSCPLKIYQRLHYAKCAVDKMVQNNYF